MKDIVVQIAKEAIRLAFDNKELNYEKFLPKNPWLKESGASFVTLSQNGKLRGCIGSLIAQRPLIEDVTANALNAAFKDSRFNKLKKEEFVVTDVEVSLLSKPQHIEYDSIEDLKRKITPFKDGVIISLGEKQATFLPQVWEELPEFESFFGHLLHKANLPLDSFKNHPEVYTYEVEKFF